MVDLLLIASALALLPAGWFASAWHHKRKLHALQRQLNAVRQTAAEHATQARRQIGQLQAELAARSARPPASRTARASTPPARVEREAWAALAVPELPAHGFAATAILPHGVDA